ncbi:hypothetical protein SAMN05421741_109112 [Paenimyroides ummariense]|uniref:Uncharacterized protein n=1 Tax=Paenimyroides ummariense TaxID=913024 RepID=A0A1I5B9B0_9FLAO|nr:hypothetical protein [Paenimyroides ummariense]SFN71267.1 hypothetical protein SAMN05421741_109112 [Paenimyroides ummariense]
MIESYKKALKDYYEIQKEDDQIRSLLNPTPAGLREILILKMKEELDSSDKKIIEDFFDVPFAELTLNKLRSETDKFKALANFLKEKSGGSDLRRLEMVALILDFKQRPYRKFEKHYSKISEVEDIVDNQKTNFDSEEPNVESSNNEVEKPEIEEVVDKEIVTIEAEVNTPKVIGSSEEVSIQKRKNVPLKKIGIIGIVSVIIGFSLFLNFKTWTTKDCMVWKGDKYEAVDCTETINSFAETTLPKDDKLIKEFRKMKVDSKTSFFDKKGNPKIWYIKNPNGILEFYNQPGLQPETGKTLKPISRYIIQEYVLNEKK